jgi:tetratricopeptide (TPR) repeat protein
LVIALTVHRIHAEAYAHTQATWDLAIAEYQQILQITPEDMTTRGNLAMLQYQQHNYQAAIEGFQHVLASGTENPDIQKKLIGSYLHLGRNALQQEHYQAALDYFSKALPLAEQYALETVAELAGLQAEIYYHQDKVEQAYSAAQQAVEEGAPSSKPYLILMFLSLRKGEQDRALSFLHQAAQRGFEANDAGGVLLIDTGYGDLTIPVSDISAVSQTSVTLKSGEVFKGNVQLKEEIPE